MVDARLVISVPLGLRLMAVNLDGDAVDVERHPLQAPPTVFCAQPPRGEFQRALAQSLQVAGLGHDRGEARKRRLRGQPRLCLQRCQPG